MAKLTQYVIAGERRVTHASPERRARGTRVGIEYQPTQNADVLPGLLDLPTGQLAAKALERYLVISALFFDHLIVPDGWLHCAGPVSEYLRGEYEKASNAQTAGAADTFDDNMIFRLLREEILVPALRGNHPRHERDTYRGYNLADVWNGRVADEHGNRMGMGVYIEDAKRRMAILDPDDTNKTIVQGMADATRRFVDWTSPDVSVDRVGHNDDADRDAWDTTFSTTVTSLIATASKELLPTLDLAALKNLQLLSDPTILDATERFCGELNDRITGLNGKLRRGDLEREVAGAFNLDRLNSYAQLYRLDQTPAFRVQNPFATEWPSAPLHLATRQELATALLDRVTTIQEAMFSRKCHCSIGLPYNLSEDLYYTGLANDNGLASTAASFDYERILLCDSPIDFSALSVSTITRLRDAHREYFHYAATAKPGKQFWNTNKNLRKCLEHHLTDIAAAAPVTRVTLELAQWGTQAGISGLAQEIVGIAGEFGALKRLSTTNG